jgi:hypothetical protein
MLTLIALSAVLMQDPPQRPSGPDELRTSFVMVGGEGRGALDRDGDGQVSREEFAAPLNDSFGRMDKDGDGRLSADEMSAGHGDAHGIMVRRAEGGPGVHRFEMRGPMSGEGRDIVIRRADGSDGPRVSRFEFRTPADGDHPAVLRELTDGRGEARIVRRLRRDGGPSDGRIEVVALDGAGSDRSLDTDSDGRLSEAEFTAPLRDAFARLDADRSGFVEESERGGDGDVRVFSRRIETRGEAGD